MRRPIALGLAAFALLALAAAARAATVKVETGMPALSLELTSPEAPVVPAALSGAPVYPSLVSVGPTLPVSEPGMAAISGGASVEAKPSASAAPVLGSLGQLAAPPGPGVSKEAGSGFAAAYDGGAALRRGGLDVSEDRIRAPTAAEAARIASMGRMAESFLRHRGMWVPERMAPHGPDNPEGLKGIVVGDRLLGAIGYYQDGYIVLSARHIAKIPPRYFAATLLHELMHHLDPVWSADELLSHLAEIEFTRYVRERSAEADSRVRGPLEITRRALGRTVFFMGTEARYRRAQAAVERAYDAGRMEDLISWLYADQVAAGRLRHPVGFTQGSSGAGKFAQKFFPRRQAELEAELSRLDPAAPSYAADRARLEGMRRRVLAGADVYGRVVIPLLEAYEKASGRKPL